MGRVWRDDEEDERRLAQTREHMNIDQARKDLVAMGRVIMGMGIVVVTLIIIMVNL